MNALTEVLGVCAVFATSGIVTATATQILWRRENRRRRHEASEKWRSVAKRECEAEYRLISFRMAEDYRAERDWSEHSSDGNSTTRSACPKRDKRCANTVVKGCLAEKFYALDETARKAVLTR